MYESPDGGIYSDPVGSIGGDHAYFVAQSKRSTYEVGESMTNYWAYTRADNSEWGWVPILFLSHPPANGPYPGLNMCADDDCRGPTVREQSSQSKSP